MQDLQEVLYAARLALALGELRKMAAQEVDPHQGEQSHVYFHGYHPAQRRAGGYDQYHFSRADLAHILQNWDDVADWQAMTPMKSSQNQGYHATAIKRPALSAPIRDLLAKDQGGKPDQRVLYHGIGQDEIGGQALARGGKYIVEGYDPYHPDPQMRRLPDGQFDEVHSHYTLNVVGPKVGRQILQELHDKLKDGGRAVVTVRRDPGKGATPAPAAGASAGRTAPARSAKRS